MSLVSGVTLPLQQRFPLRDQLELATRAEALGYDSVWVPEVNGPDAFAVLTAIAARTQRVRLATGVLPVQVRSPVTTAYAAATVDALAPGRVMLGVGTSSPVIVGGWHGIGYDAPLRTMREAIAVIRAVLSGEKTAVSGARYSSRGFRLPLRPSPIPLYVGALNERMLRLAGELADGVLLNWVPAHAIAAKVSAVHAGAAAAGREPGSVDIACYVRTCVTEDASPTREHLRRELTGYVPVPTYRRQFETAGYASEVERAAQRWAAGDRAGAVAEMSDRLVDEINAIGSVTHCRARLEAFARAGVTTLIVSPWSGNVDAAAEIAATLEALAPSRA